MLEFCDRCGELRVPAQAQGCSFLKVGSSPAICGAGSLHAVTVLSGSNTWLCLTS